MVQEAASRKVASGWVTGEEELCHRQAPCDQGAGITLADSVASVQEPTSSVPLCTLAGPLKPLSELPYCQQGRTGHPCPHHLSKVCCAHRACITVARYCTTHKQEAVVVEGRMG